MYFDTHCHLSLFKDIPATIAKAKAHSIQYILAVSMYYKDNWKVLELAKTFPEVVPALGIHPIEVPNLTEVEKKLEIIDNLVLEYNIKVIGEIGLDRYFNKEAQVWEKQELILRHFLDFAHKYNLVVNLHGKSAEQVLFEVLSEYNLRKVVVHWFAGSPELISEGINRGYYFSVTPAVSYAKTMQTVAEMVPLRQLLSESDGPVKFKGPSPCIGEPALMEKVVKEIAHLKGQNFQETAQILYQNAKKLLIG